MNNGRLSDATLFQKGQLLFDQQRYHQAIEIFYKIGKSARHTPRILHLIGVCEVQIGKVEQGLKKIETAVALEPAWAPALYDCAEIYRRIGRVDEALSIYRRILVSAPEHLDSALVLARLTPFIDEAQCLLQSILSIRPRLPQALWLQSMVDLSIYKFSSGWNNYAERWNLPAEEFSTQKYDKGLLSLPWGGGAPNAPLWVWTEQGVGDEILFTSVLNDVIKAGWPIKLGGRKRSLSLLRRSFPKLDVIDVDVVTQKDLKDCKYQIPLGDLAGRFRPDVPSFGEGLAYLKPDRETVGRLRQRYLRDGKKLVGLAWRSQQEPRKSISLQELEPILRLPGITYVNLQYGETDKERELAYQAYGVELLHDPDINPLGPLDLFAAQVASMDAVVTTSNTTAHFAGALGIPGLVILPTGGGLHWYWFREREDCLWYRSLKLLRQKSAGEWQSVVVEASRRLQILLN